MKIEVRYFAQLRETAGMDSENIEFKSSATVMELLDRLKDAHRIEIRGLSVAVNEEFVSQDTALKDGDSVALLPPVSGG